MTADRRILLALGATTLFALPALMVPIRPAVGAIADTDQPAGSYCIPREMLVMSGDMGDSARINALYGTPVCDAAPPYQAPVQPSTPTKASQVDVDPLFQPSSAGFVSGDPLYRSLREQAAGDYRHRATLVAYVMGALDGRAEICPRVRTSTSDAIDATLKYVEAHAQEDQFLQKNAAWIVAAAAEQAWPCQK